MDDPPMGGTIEDPVKNFHETLCTHRCLQAFFFYSGVFVIDLHWGLFWHFLPSYLEIRQYFSSGSLNWLLLFVPLCCILFSLLFGALTSIQQSSNTRQSTAILLVVFGIGLGVSSLGFSTIPIFSQASGNNNWVYGLAMICFFLIAMTISGYTASFFSLSIYFSDQIISISALPFWAAMGQLASIGIVYISSALSNSPFQLLTIFAIETLLVMIFTIVFWFFIRNTLPPSAGSEGSQAFCSLLRLRFGSDFRKDLKNYFSRGFFFSMLLFAIFFNASIFYVELRIDGWSEFFRSAMGYRIFLYENDMDFVAQIRLYQQIMQLSTSILFFTLQFCFIKYCIRPPDFLQGEIPTSTKGSREYVYHVDKPHMYKFFHAQWVTSLAAWIGLVVTCIYLALISFQNGSLLDLMFALTGFGRTLIYSGRELQRSSMRMVRFQKGYEHTEVSVKQSDFFDAFVQTGFYSTLLALGQVLTIWTMEFSPLNLPLYIFIGGSFLFLIVWPPGYLCRTCWPTTDSKNGPNTPGQVSNLEGVQTKVFDFRSMVVFRTSKKHAY
jgi:hypothetical protein